MAISPLTILAGIKKAYDIYREVSSYFSDSTEPTIPQLIYEAKEEIINEIREVQNQQLLARVKSQIERFISFGYHSPDQGEINRFIEDGIILKSELETTIEDNNSPPRIAYKNSIPYNSIIPMLVSVMRKRGDRQQMIDRVLGQTLETNKLLIGYELYTNRGYAVDTYSCPPGKWCFIDSKVWRYLYEGEQPFKTWNDKDCTIKCYGYKKYSVKNKPEVTGIYAEAYFDNYVAGLVSYADTNSDAGRWMSQCENMLLKNFMHDPVFRVVAGSCYEIKPFPKSIDFNAHETKSIEVLASFILD
jgi:hypothetical protein